MYMYLAVAFKYSTTQTENQHCRDSLLTAKTWAIKCTNWLVAWSVSYYRSFILPTLVALDRTFWAWERWHCNSLASDGAAPTWWGL